MPATLYVNKRYNIGRASLLGCHAVSTTFAMDKPSVSNEGYNSPPHSPNVRTHYSPPQAPLKSKIFLKNLLSELGLG